MKTIWEFVEIESKDLYQLAKEVVEDYGWHGNHSRFDTENGFVETICGEHFPKCSLCKLEEFINVQEKRRN